jgi:dynein heavy chain
MHPNAELSLLTSLGETLFRTVADVSGGSGGGRRGEGQTSATEATPSLLARIFLCLQ